MLDNAPTTTRYLAQRTLCPRLPARDALAEVRATLRLEAEAAARKAERARAEVEHPAWVRRMRGL